VKAESFERKITHIHKPPYRPAMLAPVMRHAMAQQSAKTKRFAMVSR
jgi:hypothetical protein